MPRMTELEENTLRSLLARHREEDPVAFVDLLLQTLLIRLDDNSISGFKHHDDDKIPDALFVVFKGYKPAEWAEQSLVELKDRLKTLTKESEDEEG